MMLQATQVTQAHKLMFQVTKMMMMYNKRRGCQATAQWGVATRVWGVDMTLQFYRSWGVVQEVVQMPWWRQHSGMPWRGLATTRRSSCLPATARRTRGSGQGMNSSWRSQVTRGVTRSRRKSWRRYPT